MNPAPPDPPESPPDPPDSPPDPPDSPPSADGSFGERAKGARDRFGAGAKGAGDRIRRSDTWQRIRRSDAWRRIRRSDTWQGVRRHVTWKRALAVGLPLLLLLAVAWQRCGISGCPDPEVLLAFEPGGAPVLLDREGEEFAELRPVRRDVVELDSLPEHVPAAFIAVEDRRFYDHGGVDFRRVVGAFFANIREGGVAEGASTITMQLARNAFPDRLPGSERTIRRKILETRVAREIEDDFEKDEILGLYLNHIYFGNGARGIAAAARHYFDIPAPELTLPQAALLAALVKAPAHYDPRNHPDAARERRDLVLDLMEAEGLVETEEAEAARESPIEVVPPRRVDDPDAFPAAYFVEAVRDILEEELGEDLYKRRLRIHTTLDRGAQTAAEAALTRQLQAVERGAHGRFDGPAFDPTEAARAEGSSYLQGAVVALRVEDGDVLAFVGGRDFEQSTFDRARLAQRQVGSAFKPFVYAAAVADGRSPGTILSDEPLEIARRGSPVYRPVNYDGEFWGRVTMREALVQSRNVPTVRLAQDVGTGSVADLARDAGIRSDIPEEPSMALGTLSLSPMELAEAYSSFAGMGRGVRPRFVTRVEDEEGEVVLEIAPETEDRLDPAVAWVVTDILRDVVDRGTGTGVRAAGFGAPAAGKTGTTQDAADVWFAGYTPEVVGVVWIGFDEPRPILRNATGGRLAAPVWGEMMRAVGSGGEWTRPEGVSRLAFDPGAGRFLPSDTMTPDSLLADSLAKDTLGGDTLFGDTLFGDTLPGEEEQPEDREDEEDEGDEEEDEKEDEEDGEDEGPPPPEPTPDPQPPEPDPDPQPPEPDPDPPLVPPEPDTSGVFSALGARATELRQGLSKGSLVPPVRGRGSAHSRAVR